MAAVSRARSRATAVAAAALVLAAAIGVRRRPGRQLDRRRAVAHDPGRRLADAQRRSDAPTTEPETASRRRPSRRRPPPATTPPPPRVDRARTSLPPISEPELLADIPIGDVVNVDANKPVRDYDAFVAVAVTDIERWWGETLPAGLRRAVRAAERRRVGRLPGAPDRPPGLRRGSHEYQDLNLYVAFYCEFDDFLMYDDGDQSLLAPLASQFGPAVMGIVLAHEFGHAIQSRIGALDQFLATIYTEQQADCFAGAWAGQAYRGESPLLRLGDADVRAGLIAMLEVRDPVGTDQFVEGGHGSAFDRVGAFQEGFVNGAQRCSELLDDPLPLDAERVPVQARSRCSRATRRTTASDSATSAPPTRRSQLPPAPVFLADDLNDFWRTELGSDFPALDRTADATLDGFSCSDGVRLAQDVLLCPSQNAVVYDEPDVLDLYRKFGDFTLGYFYGIAWAERAQELNGSTLQGEQRALLDDCYTGAWVRDITPDDHRPHRP